jgi:hypothetical protein
VLGVAASSGIAWIHPRREGHSPAQIGQKGQRNPRWIVGGKWCFLLNQWGVICAWDCATANIHDSHFQPLIAQCEDTMILLTDTGFHAQAGDPTNMQVGPRGTWNTRRLVDTVFSMLTTVFQSKQVGHRVWASFRARVAWTRAAFNLLAQWGMEVDEHDMVRLSIAELSL